MSWTSRWRTSSQHCNGRRRRAGLTSGVGLSYVPEHLERRDLLTPAISGVAFGDTNGDNIRQDFERPIPGALVFIDLNNDGILNPDGIPDGAATEPFFITDSAGTYHFTSLPPQAVKVTLQVPGALTVSRDVTLTSNSEFTNVNLPVRLGTVAGVLFEDLNRNGQRGDLEPGLSGLTVFSDTNNNGLLDPSEPQTTSRFDGSYHLEQLLPGLVRLTVIDPSNYRSAPPPASYVSGIDLTDINIPVVSYFSSVTGTVFLDSDRNGTQGDTEIGYNTPLAVYLDLNNNSSIDVGEPVTLTGTGNQAGVFQFSDVLPGIYTVRITPPSGLAVVPGQRSIVAIAGQSQTADFALQTPTTSSLGGTLYVDRDRNQVKNGSETGLAGVLIYLATPDDAIDNDSPSSSSFVTETNADGTYQFLNVPQGTYQIKFAPIDGYTTPELVVTTTPGVNVASANIGLITKLELPANALVYSTGSASSSPTADANVTALQNEAATAQLTIRLVGRDKRDKLSFATGAGVTLSDDGKSISVGQDRVGSIKLSKRGLPMEIAFEADTFSRDSLTAILESLRYSSRKKRPSNSSARIEVRLVLDNEVIISSRKIQIVRQK